MAYSPRLGEAANKVAPRYFLKPSLQRLFVNNFTRAVFCFVWFFDKIGVDVGFMFYIVNPN